MDAGRWSLFLTLLALCSVDKGRTQDAPHNLPCPVPADIFPCICSVDEDFHMDMNCSNVLNEAELANVFTANFPFTDFRDLIIHNNHNIKVLRNGVLGLASFQKVRITDGSLEEVEEEALIQSFARLTKLHLHNNNLKLFPFHALPMFTSILELDLDGNSLQDLHLMISDSLMEIDLSVNLIGNLEVNTFTGLKKIKCIFAINIGLTEIVSGTFSNLDNMKVVDLFNNQLTHIPEGAFNFSGNEDTFLDLANNQISTIETGGIIGALNGKMLFYNNSLTILSEEVFRRFFEDGNKVLLEGNPLECGCEIAWLITNPTFMDQLETVESPAACYNGEFLVDLDPKIYENLCSF